MREKLLKEKSLESEVMNRESSKKERLQNQLPEYAYKERLPATWRRFHTPNDNKLSLTPESFTVMANILKSLAEAKAMA